MSDRNGNDTQKILLVDDDANERGGVQFLIHRGKMPLEVREAPNGKRALDMIRAEPVDILFTDVKMPYMDGLELADIVSREYPNIKIIVFSAYGEFEYAKRAMKANAVTYLLKPIDINEFETVMKNTIRQCEEEAIALQQRRNTESIDLQWKRTEESFASGEKSGVMEQTRLLLAELAKRGTPGIAYARYVFYDLITKLFKNYAAENGSGLQRRLQQLDTCQGAKAIEALMDEVLDETLFLGRAADLDVSRMVQRIIRIIKNQYGEDLSLDRLAEQVGLAPSYLSYVFKRETGKTLIKYLTDHRMEKARQMLDEGKLKIVQVAKKCGYENQSYFNRLFKQTYGITPKQYKERKHE